MTTTNGEVDRDSHPAFGVNFGDQLRIEVHRGQAARTKNREAPRPRLNRGKATTVAAKQFPRAGASSWSGTTACPFCVYCWCGQFTPPQSLHQPFCQIHHTMVMVRRSHRLPKYAAILIRLAIPLRARHTIQHLEGPLIIAMPTQIWEQMTWSAHVRCLLQSSCLPFAIAKGKTNINYYLIPG